MGTKRFRNDEESKDRFKTFRKIHKKTQTEWAIELGISLPTVQRYESGASEPGAAIIKTLHDRFNMSYSWWGSGEGPMIIERNLATMDFTNEISEIATDKVLKMTLDLLKTFNERIIKIENELSELKNKVESKAGSESAQS